MITRSPARIVRAVMGLCAAALLTAQPVHADETWLRQAFQRTEALHETSTPTSREYREQQHEGRIRSRSRPISGRPRPSRLPKPTASFALNGAVPIVGSILSMVGLHEQRDRSRLQAMIGVDPARIPWCGFLMGWAVRQAGRMPPPGHGMARSWTTFGSPISISSAQAGDVIVTRTGRGAHVAAFHSRRGDSVCVAGGNQTNRVSIACVPAHTVVAVRR